MVQGGLWGRPQTRSLRTRKLDPHATQSLNVSFSPQCIESSLIVAPGRERIVITRVQPCETQVDLGVVGVRFTQCVQCLPRFDIPVSRPKCIPSSSAYRWSSGALVAALRNDAIAASS